MSSDVTAPPDPATEAPSESSPPEKKSNVRTIVLLVILFTFVASVAVRRGTKRALLRRSVACEVALALVVLGLAVYQAAKVRAGAPVDQAMIPHQRLPSTCLFMLRD
mgnify:CR=1 FL=1